MGMRDLADFWEFVQSQTYAQLIASKILNGISIGMLVPSLQALMGDMHTAANRGKAFGYLNFTGMCVCNM
jgi:MFS family permease